MTRSHLMAAWGLSVAGALACGPRVDPEEALQARLAERQARLEQALAAPEDLQPDAPVARWILPARLAELSGMTLTADDRLFAHGDESGKVYQIDYRRGVIVKEFALGPPAVLADFEAITAVGDSLILMTSRGVLYRFVEGEDGEGVEYIKVDTGLGDRCEFEGMAFDSLTNSLILACKNVRDNGRNDAMLLYRWPLGGDSTTAAQPPEEIVVPLSAMVGRLGWDRFEPSDINISPRTGNYVIVASGQQGLVEITPGGGVVFSRLLPRGHAQPEALAITHDNLLLLGDEAAGEEAVLTIYRRQE
jgi:hypothetical protein